MSKNKKKTGRRPDDLVEWARRATVGLDESTTMIGIVDWTKADRQSNR
jgi:hypothetical protein